MYEIVKNYEDGRVHILLYTPNVEELPVELFEIYSTAEYTGLDGVTTNYILVKDSDSEELVFVVKEEEISGEGDSSLIKTEINDTNTSNKTTYSSTKIEKKFGVIENELNDKLSIKQSVDIAGKVLKVGDDGNIEFVEDIENSKIQTLVTDVDNNKAKIAEHTSQLRDIENKNNPNKSKNKYRGLNMLYGDANYIPPKANLINTADWIVDCGSNAVLAALYIDVTSANEDFRICFKIDDVISTSEYLFEKGVKTLCIKVHYVTTNKSDFKNPTDTFLNNLKTKVYEPLIEALKPYGLEYATLTNELGVITGSNASANNITFAKNLTSYFTSKGIKTMISCEGYEEAFSIHDEVFELLDLIGINNYVSVSYNGVDTNVGEAKNKFYEDHAIDYKHAIGLGKKIWITETGSQDYVNCLSAPEKWDWDTTTTDTKTDGVVQSIYYDVYLNTVSQIEGIEGLFFWDSIFFAPVEKTREIIKKYWR